MTDHELKLIKQGSFISKLYAEQSLAVDCLAYTANLRDMVEQINAKFPDNQMSETELFPLLIDLRKSGFLVKQGRARNDRHPLTIDATE